jgi:serine protease Do
VNPGNSGGPLFNLKGEVVGVNSQIFSGNGGYLGISFAIPANIAMSTANQLIKSGKVNRGRIGVLIGPVSKDAAEALSLPNDKGALVQSVEKDGPAEKAGLLAQDIILKINGKLMDSNSDVVRTIANMAPATKVVMTIWRKGSTRDISVTVGEAPAEKLAVKVADKKKDEKKDAKPNRIGLVLSDLDAAERKELKVEQGVLVSDVEGAAARAGIREGDVVLAVNTVDVKSSKQLNELIDKLDAKKAIALVIKRENDTRLVTLRIDSK